MNNKPFSWSYSKLKNFETCPKRHLHVDILKDVKEEESEHLTWGNEVHRHLARRIGKGIPLPEGYDQFEPWAKRVLSTAGDVLVEQKLAINENFQPVPFFDRSAWLRVVADVVKISGPVGLVVDWKTGKVLHDSVQLALTAACVFAHHPELNAIRTEFAWLKEGNECSTRDDFWRAEMVEQWKVLWPRIESLKKAYINEEFPAQPGRLCRNWCPVVKCPHHGE